MPIRSCSCSLGTLGLLLSLGLGTIARVSVSEYELHQESGPGTYAALRPKEEVIIF